MKKILFILMVLGFSACEKDEVGIIDTPVPPVCDCNCGEIMDIWQGYGLDLHYISVKNNCSDIRKPWPNIPGYIRDTLFTGKQICIRDIDAPDYIHNNQPAYDTYCW